MKIRILKIRILKICIAPATAEYYTEQDKRESKL
jgi:hypothetical protein